MHLSQKWLEIERNGQTLGSHVLSMFTVKHFQLFENLKIALISETVRERAKRWKFGTFFNFLKISKFFKKNKKT